MKTGLLEVGQIGLVQQQPDGTIIQVGLNSQQSLLLNTFLATLSKSSPFAILPEEWNLKLIKE